MYHTMVLVNNSVKKLFVNIAGKGENVRKQHFHLCPQSFMRFSRDIRIAVCNAFNLENAKIWRRVICKKNCSGTSH